MNSNSGVPDTRDQFRAALAQLDRRRKARYQQKSRASEIRGDDGRDSGMYDPVWIAGDRWDDHPVKGGDRFTYVLHVGLSALPARVNDGRDVPVAVGAGERYGAVTVVEDHDGDLIAMVYTYRR